MRTFLRRICGAIVALSICLGAGVDAKAGDENYGASAAFQVADDELTVKNMLVFALEDEYLARGEYQKIIEHFGAQRPFTNIIKAEERHISWLKPLFAKYDAPLPPDRGLELALLPGTFSETFQMGIDAEKVNINMYKRFLNIDLPGDIRQVFDHLLRGSENHLAAFTRGKGRLR